MDADNFWRAWRKKNFKNLFKKGLILMRSEKHESMECEDNKSKMSA